MSLGQFGIHKSLTERNRSKLANAPRTITGSRVSACTENDSMQPVPPLRILQGFAFHNAKALGQVNLGAVVSQLSVAIL